MAGELPARPIQCAWMSDHSALRPDRKCPITGIVVAALRTASSRQSAIMVSTSVAGLAAGRHAWLIAQPGHAGAAPRLPRMAASRPSATYGKGVSLKLFGVSLAGLRLWPALAAWATVVISGLTAREFGGGRRAQLLAAIATATMPALLAIDHLFGPTAFDVLAWSGLALIVARIGRTGDARWWLAAGLVLGLGLANKHSAGFFAVALLAGALLSGGRRLVANRWLLAGAVIAAAFTIPDIWWQAQHQWATIAMTRVLNQENGGLGNIGDWIIGQLIMTAVALVWVWAAGLRWLWRSERPLWRALAFAYGLLFVFFALTTGAKIYYLAGAYVYLLAAGAVAIDGWLAARPGRLRNLMLATGLTTAVALPIVLPVLPAADIGWTYKLNQDPAESIGWPQLLSTVRTAWTSLPPLQQASAVIFTSNYGEASAINLLGRGTGLPQAVSRGAPGTIPTGGGDQATPAPPPCWPSCPGRPAGPATAPTCTSSSPACGQWPRSPTRTASTTRNGTATSTCAPARADRGTSSGPGCATTADSRGISTRNPASARERYEDRWPEVRHAHRVPRP